MTIPNIPAPDELAEVREQIKALQAREEALRGQLLDHPELREGKDWLAEVKTVKQTRTDIKELRACHPDLVAEFTFPTEVRQLVLSRVTEDGELIPTAKYRKQQSGK